jgi:hypothetical protein
MTVDQVHSRHQIIFLHEHLFALKEWRIGDTARLAGTAKIILVDPDVPAGGAECQVSTVHVNLIHELRTSYGL